MLINLAQNPLISRRRFPIRSWYPSQHLLRQNPPPRSQFGSRRGCPAQHELPAARDGAGNPIEVVRAWSDVTARKQLAEALAAAQERLRQQRAAADHRALLRGRVGPSTQIPRRLKVSLWPRTSPGRGSFLAGNTRHVPNRRRLLMCDHGAIAIAVTMTSPTRTAAAARYICKPSKR